METTGTNEEVAVTRKGKPTSSNTPSDSPINPRDSVKSVLSELSLVFQVDPTSYCLALLFVLKVIFVDICIPLGAVVTDFWQVQTFSKLCYEFALLCET